MERVIHMIGPHDRAKFLEDENAALINVTSQSQTWHKCFSPFFLGPCKLYDAYGAWNVENAWQYAKVYKQHLDAEGLPAPIYFEWARQGWARKRAVRYPMGKGSVPAYSWWDGKKLGYVAAKREIYIPLYRDAVRADGQLSELIYDVQSLWKDGAKVGFFDFDVFDNVKEEMTFEEVLNSNRKLGHAFVLADMIEKELNP